MESYNEHILEDFDPNWGLDCFLFEDNASIYGDFSFASNSTLPWPTHPLLNSLPSSGSLISVHGEDSGVGGLGNESSQKRAQEVLSSTSKSKANREKMRRARLNERFLELCTALEPGKTPKLDKATILNDAIRTVNLLQEQTSKLKNQNKELKDKIKELKAEKNELRMEKHWLKVEKEDIEQRIKALGAYHDHELHTISIQSSYTTPYQVVARKMKSFVHKPSISLWQFASRAGNDDSQDHVLHPTVA